MLGRSIGCSFCGRNDSEVAKLAAGPRRMFGRVYICDRCAAQTIRIMEAQSGDEQSSEKKPSLLRRTLNRLGWERRDDVPSRSECHALLRGSGQSSPLSHSRFPSNEFYGC